MSDRKVDWAKLAKDREVVIEELQQLVAVQKAAMTEQGDELEKSRKVMAEASKTLDEVTVTLIDAVDYIERLETKVLEHEIGPRWKCFGRCD